MRAGPFLSGLPTGCTSVPSSHRTARLSAIASAHGHLLRGTHQPTRRGDVKGRAVPEAERATVRTRSVEADLKWLRWVFNWAAKWRTPQGQYLMRENPVRGYEIPTEKNPSRPVASTDRYEAIRSISDQQQMEIRWNGKRQAQRSYLSELLDIVNGTGRGISDCPTS